MQKFLSSWTYRLHRLGYLSGVYGSAGSTMKSLVDIYSDPNYYRPDAIWNGLQLGVATIGIAKWLIR